MKRSELRQIIKEEIKRVLNERKLFEELNFNKPFPDLGKPLEKIGQEIEGKLKGMGYSTKLFMDKEVPSNINKDLEEKTDSKLAAISFFKPDPSVGGSAQLEIRVHKNNADDLKKVVDSYNFPKENGGYKGNFASGGDLVRAQIFSTEK